MEREKKLAKNTMILAIGSYLPKVTALVTLPLLTEYLTKAEYGTYDLISTLVSLLLPAFTLQIQSAAFRFLISCRDSAEKITAIVSNIFAFTLPASAIGLFITYFCLGTLGTGTRVWMLLYFFVDILYIGMGQVARGLGHNAYFAFAAILNSVVNMCGICLTLLVLHEGLNGIICSIIIGGVAAVLFLGVSTKIYLFIRPSAVSKEEIKRLLAYSWPMVPNALSNWVLSLSDRLVLLNFIGIEANAVYAVANKIPNLISAFRNNFTSAWQENASLSVEDDDKMEYYSGMLDSINRLIVALIACLIAFTPLLFRILIRGDYEEAYQQMSILYLGVYFASMAQFVGGIYIAYMKTKSVGITTMLAALCNLVIDLLLVSQIGIFAASVSTLVSYCVLFVFRLFDVQKFQQLKVNYATMLFYVGVVIVMSILVSMRVLWVDVFNGILGLCFAGIINRNIVRAVVSRLIVRKAG